MNTEEGLGLNRRRTCLTKRLEERKKNRSRNRCVFRHIDGRFEEFPLRCP